MSIDPLPSNYESMAIAVQSIGDEHHRFREEAQTDLNDLRGYRSRIGHLCEEYRVHLERLEGIDRNAEMIERRLTSRIESLPTARRDPTNLNELIQHVGNEHQCECLRRLTYTNQNLQVYLSSYTTGNGSPRDVEGVFEILGTVRNGSRESYKVTWYKQGCGPRGSFWCSCPDQKFNGGKKNMYCKHISFLVCRVGQIFSPEFFASKQFTVEQHAQFKQRVESAFVFRDPALIATASTATVRAPLVAVVKPEFCCTKAIEEGDSCPVCYDDMAGEAQLLGCPTCKNNIHRQCMEVWLERNNTCVYCRSDVWRNYRR